MNSIAQDLKDAFRASHAGFNRERIRARIQRKLQAVVNGEELPAADPEPRGFPGVDVIGIRARLEAKLSPTDYAGEVEEMADE